METQFRVGVVVLVGHGESRGILHAHETVCKVVDVARLGAAVVVPDEGEVARVVVEVLVGRLDRKLVVRLLFFSRRPTVLSSAFAGLCNVPKALFRIEKNSHLTRACWYIPRRRHRVRRTETAVLLHNREFCRSPLR